MPLRSAPWEQSLSVLCNISHRCSKPPEGQVEAWMPWEVVSRIISQRRNLPMAVRLLSHPDSIAKGAHCCAPTIWWIPSKPQQMSADLSYDSWEQTGGEDRTVYTWEMPGWVESQFFLSIQLSSWRWRWGCGNSMQPPAKRAVLLKHN